MPGSASRKQPDERAGEGNALSLEERVQAVLNLIRPAVQSDGGDLELVAVEGDGTVLVRFHGACVGCPSSDITLQVGIEKQLKDRIPEIVAVRSVD